MVLDTDTHTHTHTHTHTQQELYVIFSTLDAKLVSETSQEADHTRNPSSILASRRKIWKCCYQYFRRSVTHPNLG